jgi:hypothetical protein
VPAAPLGLEYLTLPEREAILVLLGSPRAREALMALQGLWLGDPDQKRLPEFLRPLAELGGRSAAPARPPSLEKPGGAFSSIRTDRRAEPPAEERVAPL